MSDWPNIALPSLPTVTPFHPESLGGSNRAFLAITGGVTAATTSTTAGSQIAQFFPWAVEMPTKIVKGFVMNGASVNGNVDVGVYDWAFNKIVSIGATLQAGANAIQELDITDTVINPGRYWIAFLCTGTGTVFARSAADENIMPLIPILELTGQTALPATAAAVKSTAATPIIPLFGFSTDTVI